MTTIGLTVATDSAGKKKVVASVLNAKGDPIPGSDGSFEAASKEDVYWKSCGDNWGGGGKYDFRLQFEKNKKPSWPFFLPKRNSSLSLIVLAPTAPDTETTIKPNYSTNDEKDWKYFADVPSHPTIGKLDPMIIIRGRPYVAVTFAAIAGAVAGALLSWLLLRGFR